MATQDNGISADVIATTQKYAQEKEKRLRPDGIEQYIELSDSDRYRKLEEDPWVDHASLNAQSRPLKDGDDVKVIILGAGFGGLVYAVRFIQAGFRPEDIRLVEAAGGFGGTWYWNRYPGLMCDVESYVYMPLLEEMDYMPKHRYSYGTELLEYTNKIAAKWELTDKALFRTTIYSYEWDASAKRWIVKMEENRGPEGKQDLTVKAQFVVLANGVLNHPKVPKNLEPFEGPMFHTARWDYNISGGSPADPSLSGLKDKRVGIIGTGATAIQAVPQLAKWCKELYVFQRTPSAVDERGQKATDPEEWKTRIATSPGWQERRCRNFNSFLAGVPQDENLVNDRWSNMKAYKAIIAGPHEPAISMEATPAHIGNLLALDAERADRVRRRVDEIVKDKKTAESLKAWYPGWCKRPTFHDDYLPVFNEPHVTLVDTDGKGVERATKNSIIAAGKEYPIDILILSTGFRPTGVKMGEPSSMSNATVRGVNGRLLSEKWAEKGPSTLHGVVVSGFPNLFLTGPMQVGASANFAYVQDVLARHCAYIASEAVKEAGKAADRVTVNGTAWAEETWSIQIMMRAGWFAGLGICTPSYITNEGEMGKTMEDQMRMIRGAPYPFGMNAFTDVLEAWRAEGSLKGILIKV